MADQTEVGALAPLPPNGRRVFLADLHLDGADTPRARTFRALLKRLAAEAAETPTELYILGDLFEYWEEYHRQVPALYEADLAALEALHKAGVKIFLLSGNRDFAYGKYVKRRFGATLLGDGGALRFGDGRNVWLEHGDLLCTADRRYLRYRAIVRSWPVKLLFWLMPWSVAKGFIGDLRQRTAADKKRKSAKEVEIDRDAARARLEAHGCQLLLCGHTHRPLADDLGAGYRLIVLPAWCDTCAGYREKAGGLMPVRFEPDGTPGPADAQGKPAPA